MSHETEKQSLRADIPLVVHVGFSGSRRLFDKDLPEEDLSRLESEVAAQLAVRLGELREHLKLSPSQFLCGVSQLAIGGDTAFARACGSQKLLHRLLLPLPLTRYITDVGADGSPDFTASEKTVAETLAAQPNVIEHRTVSTDEDRSQRFDEANLAILKLSDVAVCLERPDPDRRVGGTGDFAARAVEMGIPLFRWQVTVRDGHALLSGASDAIGSAPGVISAFPLRADGLRIRNRDDTSSGMLAATEYMGSIKEFTSRETRTRRWTFKLGAVGVIAFHAAATLLATMAAVFQRHSWMSDSLAALLAAELFLLGAGLCLHGYLHRSGTARAWAVSRLLAEAMRSGQAMCTAHVAPQLWSRHQWPSDFQAVLRTCEVLALNDQRARSPRVTSTLEFNREAYVQGRILDKQSGQMVYYDREERAASRKLRSLNIVFYACIGVAICIAGHKLFLALATSPQALLDTLPSNLSDLKALAAIVLPVFAVGLLSWAAATDLEARVHTFRETRRFLEAQVHRFERTRTLSEFSGLVRQTESRLLNETIQWFSRRTFTGVS